MMLFVFDDIKIIFLGDYVEPDAFLHRSKIPQLSFKNISLMSFILHTPITSAKSLPPFIKNSRPRYTLSSMIGDPSDIVALMKPGSQFSV